jgi:uncharacterized protein with PIN domain
VFVDASAMVSILLQEAGGERLAEVIDAPPSAPLVTNVIAVWEIYRKKSLPLSVAAKARAQDFLARRQHSAAGRCAERTRFRVGRVRSLRAPPLSERRRPQ